MTAKKNVVNNIGSLAQKKREEIAKIPMTSLLYLSLVISILTVCVVIFVQNSLPPEIPLFYGLAQGEEQLSSPIGLLLPTICALVILIINTTIALNLKNELMQKTLVMAAFAATFFSLVTTVQIILLVGSF